MPRRKKVDDELGASMPLKFGSWRFGKWKDPKTGKWRESPFLTVTWGWDGERQSKSLKTNDVAVVRQFLREKWKERMNGLSARPKEEKAPLTIQQLWDWLEEHYQTKKSKDKLYCRTQHLKKFFKDRGLTLASEITNDVYAAYFRERTTKGRAQTDRGDLCSGAAPSTVRNELTSIGKAFNIAREEKKVITTVPTWDKEVIRDGEAIQKYWTDEQFERFEPVIRRMDDDVADVARFYYLMGWRRCEVLRLRWDTNVNLDTKSLVVESYDTKNGKWYDIPYEDDPELSALIEKRRRLADEHEAKHGKPMPWVFFRQRFPNRPIVAFYHIWTKALIECGLPHKGRRKRLGCHDFVRTAVGRWAESVDPKLGASMINKSPGIFGRYRIVGLPERQEAMRKNVARREERKARLRLVSKKTG